MNGIHLTIQSLPRIGFAHHFYTENYEQTYGIDDNSFEIVYVKSGKLELSIEDKTYIAPAGSVLFLVRQLPCKIHTMDNLSHSHCSIQLICSHTFAFFEHKDQQFWNRPGLTIPFILQPGALAEKISKTMHNIIELLHTNRQSNEQFCCLSLMGILSDLHHYYRSKLPDILPSSKLLSTQIKANIDTHIREDISLTALACTFGLSPNYLNAVFKDSYGTPVRQYINKQKAMIIAELMIHKNADFPTACENAGISDIQYGYRLFKKQLGLTPKQYISAVFHHNDQSRQSPLDE